MSKRIVRSLIIYLLLGLNFLFQGYKLISTPHLSEKHLLGGWLTYLVGITLGAAMGLSFGGFLEYSNKTDDVENKCGQYVISFITREGSYFPCGLPKGHDGGHRASGNCIKHGPYVGEVGAVPQCPYYPNCIQ